MQTVELKRQLGVSESKDLPTLNEFLSENNITHPESYGWEVEESLKSHKVVAFWDIIFIAPPEVVTLLDDDDYKVVQNVMDNVHVIDYSGMHYQSILSPLLRNKVEEIMLREEKFLTT